jgi:hypothetical protein
LKKFKRKLKFYRVYVCNSIPLNCISFVMNNFSDLVFENKSSDTVKYKAKVLFYLPKIVSENESNCKDFRFIMIREKANYRHKHPWNHNSNSNSNSNSIPKIRLNAIGGTFENKDKSIVNTIYREVNEESVNIISKESMENLLRTRGLECKYIKFHKNKNAVVNKIKIKQIHETYLFFIPWDSEILGYSPEEFLCEFYKRKNAELPEKRKFINHSKNFNRFFELEDIEIVNVNKDFNKQNINNFLYYKINKLIDNLEKSL